MASSLVHMAVAKRVNEVLNLKDEKSFIFGSISPDIAKMVGSERNISHFITKEDSDTPEINLFLNKYKIYLKNSYELGYYVHLLTDVLWFDEFCNNFLDRNCLIGKSGEKIMFSDKEICDILYNDYSCLNAEVLSYYNLDLSIFYEEFTFPENHIEELSSEYFPDVVNKLGMIATKTSDTSYVLKLESIIHFIEYATIYCLDEIKKLDL